MDIVPDEKRTTQLSLEELGGHANAEAILTERLIHEIDTATWPEDGQKDWKNAAKQVLELARNGSQTNPGGEQSRFSHVLQTTIQLMSPDYFGIRNNPRLIIAALLSGVVEDRPEHILGETPQLFKAETKHGEALVRIQQMFDTSTAVRVNFATVNSFAVNNLFLAVIGKNAPEQLRGPLRDAGLIKLSSLLCAMSALTKDDLSDTAKQLAADYKLLLPHMLAMALHAHLEQRVVDCIADKLIKINEVCATILDSQRRDYKFGHDILHTAS